MKTAFLLIAGLLVFTLTGCRAKLPASSGGNEETTTHTASETPPEGANTVLDGANTRWLGRTYEKDGFTMINWTAGGFEIRFTGAAVECYLNIPVSPPYIYVFIDSDEDPDSGVKTFLNNSGWYTLAEGLSDGEHTLTLRKTSECATTQLGVGAVRFPEGGSLLEPPPEKERRIEFIGDSITTGLGVIREEGVEDYYPVDTQDGLLSYAALTARSLGADYNMIAISGARVASANDPNNYRYLPPRYHLADPINAPDVEWDFKRFTPDIVVVALGTNDSRAILEEGQPAVTAFQEAMTAFIGDLRSHYPDAWIVCTIGMMYTNGYMYVKQAVNALGDPRVTVMLEQPGGSGHPRLAAHERTAEQLTALIRELTGWQK